MAAARAFRGSAAVASSVRSSMADEDAPDTVAVDMNAQENFDNPIAKLGLKAYSGKLKGKQAVEISLKEQDAQFDSIKYDSLTIKKGCQDSLQRAVNVPCDHR